MSDEQKQRYREVKNKCGKYKYCNMTDEQNQKEKDCQKKYKREYKNMSDEQKKRTRDCQKEYRKNMSDE